MTVLSGMSTVQQVEDNTATMMDFEPLTDEDRKVVEAALEAYRKNKTIPCTGCRYCMDCPFGVDIPGVFKAYNTFAIGGEMCIRDRPWPAPLFGRATRRT